MELEIKIVAIARVNATVILLQNFHFVNPFWENARVILEFWESPSQHWVQTILFFRLQHSKDIEK